MIEANYIHFAWAIVAWFVGLFMGLFWAAAAFSDQESDDIEDGVHDDHSCIFTPFSPCEELFPHWMTARIIISGVIPSKFKFLARNFDLCFDWAWIDSLLRLTPVEDMDKVCSLFPLLEQELQRYLGKLNFSQFLGVPLCQLTIHQVNAYLGYEEERRIARDTYVLRDLMRHLLGVTPIFTYMLSNDSTDGDSNG